MNRETLSAKVYLDEINIKVDSEEEAINRLIESHRMLHNFKQMINDSVTNMPKWKRFIANIFKFFPYDQY